MDEIAEFVKALPKAEWEFRGNDEWVFGVKVRGLVRQPLGEFYCDLDSKDNRGSWIWMTHVAHLGFQRGVSANMEFAAEDVEKALGIV